MNLKIKDLNLIGNLTNFILIVGLCSICSCSSVITIQKRLYREGYAVSVPERSNQLIISQKKLNIVHPIDRDETLDEDNTYANSLDSTIVEASVTSAEPMEVILHPSIGRNPIAKQPVESQEQGLSIKRPRQHVNSLINRQLAEARKSSPNKMDLEDILFWIGFILLFGGLILMIIWVNGDMDFDALAIMWIICYSLGFGLLSAMI